MNVLILSGYGINCEDETIHAFRKLGFKGKIVHINDLIKSPKQLQNYQVFAIPGGFSFGDDTGSGNAMAKKIRNNLFDYIHKFLEKDKLVLGICNGCQILVNLGIVPGLSKQNNQVALIENNSDIYQCRWVNLKINSNHSPWLQNIDYLHLPIAHQEGKFIIPKDVINEIKKNKLIGIQYANDNGKLANIKFPYNPNGSELDIAGLISKDGKVLAMMPHPERAFYFYHQPNWQELNKKNEYADGYKIFRNARNYFK
ncbi:phosphoribosylformylglycinamidine synthase I [Alphaproteobacteria bacterium]|nr:phosphoribosylformylglycinamidine synthase I [Alphaproteobacteria bacterium]